MRYPKNITVNLTDEERDVLVRLATAHHVSKNQIMRRALGWYHDMQKEVNTGDWRLETRIVDKNGDEVKKINYIEW